MHGINFDSKTTKTDSGETIKRLKLTQCNLISRDTIKQELNIINEELLNIQRETARHHQIQDKFNCAPKKEKCKQNTDEPAGATTSSHTKSSNDELGNQVLNLMKTMNTLVKQNQSEEFKSNMSFMFCTGLNERNLKFSATNKTKINKANFKLINVLEKLKKNVDQPATRPMTSNNFACSSNHNRNHNQPEVVAHSETYLRLLKDYSDQLRIHLSAKKETKIHLVDRSAPANESNTNVPSYVYEWKYLAIVLDRCLFFTFALVIPICLLIMSLKL